MPLSIAERKYRMPFGAQLAVATECGVSKQYVSAVMNGDMRPKGADAQKRVRRVQVAIARKLGVTVDEAFPPAVEQSVAAVA